MKLRMMFVLLCALPAMSPAMVIAETYLCVPEANGGVRNAGGKSLESMRYAVGNEKFLQSNASGSWVLKKFGNDNVLSNCTTEFSCGSLREGAVYFSRGFDGVFTLVRTVAELDEDVVVFDTVVTKGRCSKID
ncbi:hypothetical protein DXI23_20255 [Marinobacter flavimaris]|uniref:Uncharacterized protein n=1 Tax=Marinobacter flavimaris TaxID=262076 RepID=A0A3D8GXF1_9GAMM|nr:hypothetical protein [Marinobacter flavimaris]PPI78449.1 hypothetical protein MDHKLMBL_20080 [Marinobacter flavimaris]RDU39062.1 hypothetical protein DXI23_20255 [Marinobacter flavimaris]